MRGILIGVIFVTAIFPALAQESKPTIRHHREAVEDPILTAEVQGAESAMDKKDYASAERDLDRAVKGNPNNYRAWFDLGVLYNATERQPDAISAYRKSVAANPQVFESAYNLGVLLGKAGDADAAKYLDMATHLKPSANADEGLARAWLSLGQVLASPKPDEALAAFHHAAELQPKDAEPHLSAGMLLERQKKYEDAAQEFQQAAALDPKSSDALAGLVNAYTKSGKIDEAEATLRKYLELNPKNAPAHVQLGRMLATQSRYHDAADEIAAGLQIDPNDAGAQKELASLYVTTKQWEKAVPLIQDALKSSPNDATLHHDLGLSLLNLKQMKPAEDELLTAVKLKPDFGEAYNDLAIVASESKQYQLALKALEYRARYLPEVPGTYFMRATAYDHMRDYKNASANYRQFLAVAGGKYPDQEWQAKHRLIAIDPKK